MIDALILATLLTIKDPVNDAFGNGDLTPPTSAEHKTEALDITEFSILRETNLAFELSFSSLANPHNRELGFSFPIIELYIQDKNRPGGSDALLKGSGMNLDKQARWHYVLKLSGDKAELFEVQEDASFLNRPVQVSREGTTLTVETNLSRPNNLSIFGLIGHYSPFTETGWQPLTNTSSAWSYSSSTQRFPVMDIISAESDAQKIALARGLLPPISSSSGPNYWTFVMIAGLALASFGVIMRYRRRENELDVPVIIKAKENPAFEAFLASPNDVEEKLIPGSAPYNEVNSKTQDQAAIVENANESDNTSEAHSVHESNDDSSIRHSESFSLFNEEPDLDADILNDVSKLDSSTYEEDTVDPQIDTAVKSEVEEALDSSETTQNSHTAQLKQTPDEPKGPGKVNSSVLIADSSEQNEDLKTFPSNSDWLEDEEEGFWSSDKSREA